MIFAMGWWVALALIVGALIAITSLYNKLVIAERQVETLERQLQAADAAITAYRADSVRLARKADQYRSALCKVLSYRTGKMANIGHRMSAAASEGLKP